MKKLENLIIGKKWEANDDVFMYLNGYQEINKIIKDITDNIIK